MYVELSERRGKIVMSRLGLVSGVVVEDLGGDLMVMVPGSTEVLTLSGDAAEAVRRVQAGTPVVTDSVVSDLVRLGVLESSGFSRRGLVKAGAIGAGAGIAVLSMPGVAMASSDDGVLLDLTNFGSDGAGTYIEYIVDVLIPEEVFSAEDPVPLSAKVGDIRIAASDITVGTFDSGTDTLPFMIRAALGQEGLRVEVRFSWGGIIYRAVQTDKP
jgi:hypothetical protein